MASTSMRRWISASRSAWISRENSPDMRAAGAARGGFGAGIDQVGDGLGLGQVDLVVEEGALGEFAGLGHPQADAPAPGLQAARQQQLQHHRPAMGLQFQHVLAGVGVGRREMDRQALVDGAAVGRAERQVGCFARFQRAAAERPATMAATERPETRTMPTAPRPGAVAMAAIGWS